jgi:hypothetical protein
MTGTTGEGELVAADTFHPGGDLPEADHVGG